MRFNRCCHPRFRRFITVSAVGVVAALVCATECGCTANRKEAAMSVASVAVDDNALAGPHDIGLLGDIAFVAGKWGSFATVDVSDASHPRVLGCITGLADPETVYPMGGICYLGGENFLAIDVTDPREPAVLKKISDERVPSINGMAPYADYLLCASKGNHITVFDISEPGNPVLVDALHTGPLFRSPHDIATFDNYIAVVNISAKAEQHNIRIYRVAERGASELLDADNWVLESAIREPGLRGANRVHITGKYAVVGCNLANHAVAVVDISEPANARLLKSEPTFVNCCSGLTVAGDIAIAALTNAIQLFDISDPAKMRSAAAQKFPMLFAMGSETVHSGHDLVYRNGLIYVTAQFDDAVGIIRVNDSRLRTLMDSE